MNQHITTEHIITTITTDPNPVVAPQQTSSIKAFLYLAVISVFMRASMVGPSPGLQYDSNEELDSKPASLLSQTALQQSLSDPEDTDILLSARHTMSPLQLMPSLDTPMDDAGVFGVVLASAAALLNELS